MKKKLCDKRSNILANHCKCALHARPDNDKQWRIQVPFASMFFKLPLRDLNLLVIYILISLIP